MKGNHKKPQYISIELYRMSYHRTLWSSNQYPTTPQRKLCLEISSMLFPHSSFMLFRTKNSFINNIHQKKKNENIDHTVDSIFWS
jgi:hypothetical protein